jgi:protein gp37
VVEDIMATIIDWADETINPQGWGCYGPGGTKEKPRRCSYCYVYKKAYQRMRFCKCNKCRQMIPHWHPERLEKPVPGKGKRVFIQSMGDLFGEWETDEHIREVIGYCESQPQHTFYFLTKNPRRYKGFWFPGNSWLGTTITKISETYRLFHNRLNGIYISGNNKTFVSVEPIQGTFFNEHMSDNGSRIFEHYDLVIIGLSNHRSRHFPRS